MVVSDGIAGSLEPPLARSRQEGRMAGEVESLRCMI